MAGAMLTALQAAGDLRAVRGADRAVGDLAAADSELEDLALTSARGAGAAAGLLSLIQGVVLLPLAAFEASLSLPAAALALRRVRASAERLDEFMQSREIDSGEQPEGDVAPPVASPAPAAPALVGIDDVRPLLV